MEARNLAHYRALLQSKGLKTRVVTAPTEAQNVEQARAEDMGIHLEPHAAQLDAAGGAQLFERVFS